MKKTPDHSSSPSMPGGPAERGDFHYDELMTPQPDAIREYHRAQLLKPMKPAAKKKN